jgi:hypothetical protein
MREKKRVEMLSKHNGIEKKYVVCLLLGIYSSMGKIARLGHQFCIMKHDVDEIKKIVSARQFIFNKLSGRDFSCFVFFYGA